MTLEERCEWLQTLQREIDWQALMIVREQAERAEKARRSFNALQVKGTGGFADND